MPETSGRKLRTGLVTLLFTDIVGSAELKRALGDQAGVALIQRHHALVRELLGRFAEAAEIATAGDSFLLEFTKPSEAVRFALLLQGRLRVLGQQTGHPVEDRIGVHVGEVVIEEGAGAAKPKDLYGLQVDTCARVMSLAGANQILMTRFAFDSARQALRGQDLEGVGELRWLNHGPYLFKGLEEPLEVCEVRVGGAEGVTPPPSTEKAQRYVSAKEELVLGANDDRYCFWG
jgi:class 3 adenylate cyclase